jgi:hypothetical protein
MRNQGKAWNSFQLLLPENQLMLIQAVVFAGKKQLNPAKQKKLLPEYVES